MPGTWVQSLLRKLRSHMLQWSPSAANINGHHNKKEKEKEISWMLTYGGVWESRELKLWVFLQFKASKTIHVKYSLLWNLFALHYFESGWNDTWIVKPLSWSTSLRSRMPWKFPAKIQNGKPRNSSPTLFLSSVLDITLPHPLISSVLTLRFLLETDVWRF